MELDKFQSFVRSDGAGPTATLMNKVEELQDLLIQQRQTTDVAKLVDKDQTIRQLNAEIAKKNEQMEDMKSRLKKVVNVDPTTGGQ